MPQSLAKNKARLEKAEKEARKLRKIVKEQKKQEHAKKMVPIGEAANMVFGEQLPSTKDELVAFFDELLKGYNKSLGSDSKITPDGVENSSADENQPINDR